MSESRLAALLQRLRYKPGWSFTLEDWSDYRSSELRLRICASVPDALAPRQSTLLTSLIAVPSADWDEARWLHWLHRQIMGIEQHEVAEWFRLDGVAPYDPHAAAPAVSVLGRVWIIAARTLHSGASWLHS